VSFADFTLIGFGGDPLVQPSVVIPEDGGTNLYCLYNNPNGIPRRVNWYRGSTLIDGEERRDQCDCAPVPSGVNIFGSNLTFSNFRGMADGRDEPSNGTYGCWAIVPTGFDQCNFEVSVAGESLSRMVEPQTLNLKRTPRLQSELFLEAAICCKL
jgi:hypothetical protein